MKILLYTDVHFCEKSSIVNQAGDKYSLRLENLIKSINWAEDLARREGCNGVFCLGDFFDKPQLTDQELTALSDIEWFQGASHWFLVGNHESGDADLKYSSVQALAGYGIRAVSEPTEVSMVNDEVSIMLLPYVARPNDGYELPKCKGGKKRMLLSHNDLLGIRMGPIVSKAGLDPKEIEANYDFCFNGHLHNHYMVSDRIMNLGNLSGKDFGENAAVYGHYAAILNIDAFSEGRPFYELVENPYAFNFYKIDCCGSVGKLGEELGKLKNNAVVSIRCCYKDFQEAKKAVAEHPVFASRITAIHESGDGASLDAVDLQVDYHAKFIECCHEKIGADKMVDEELAEVLK